MKITFILQEKGAGMVGGIRVVYEYANHLTQRGHQVTIVYPLTPYVPRPKLQLSNLKNQLRWLKGQARWLKLNLKSGKKVGWFDVKARLVTIPSTSPSLSWLSQRFIPDADVVLATAWETAYLVSKLNQHKGKKYYFIQNYEIWPVWDSEEAWAEAEALESDPDKLCLAMHDVALDNPKLRDFKERVDATYKLPLNKIVISSWLKELVEAKFGEAANGPIPNGTNFETFHLEDTPRFGKRVLMPWRPAKWKGTQDGLKALAMARQRHPEAEFGVHGNPADADLPDWITGYGRVSDDELRHLYNQAGIYVIPSWVEGSQLPPMEAMACGCAVVATNVGGVTDYAVADKTVLVSPPRNPEALAANISALLEDAERRARMAQAGNKYIAQFTWERATDNLEKILQANP
ncbi:MAG: glycosyltransferase family 4 protein [Candidatus Bathyarchaeota archaeon]|nr:glycosyltransferase family 4 protein [Candidatus Bathyarchaeota archaeon]